jgi:hypothetical protein
MRLARKLYLKLGGDPADDAYPDKPKRLRWPWPNSAMTFVAMLFNDN